MELLICWTCCGVKAKAKHVSWNRWLLSDAAERSRETALITTCSYTHASRVLIVTKCWAIKNKKARDDERTETKRLQVRSSATQSTTVFICR